MVSPDTSTYRYRSKSGTKPEGPRADLRFQACFHDLSPILA